MNKIRGCTILSLLLLVMPIVSCATAASSHRLSLLALPTIIDLAETYKAEWLRQNPSESETIGPATIKKVESTPSGWHFLYEHITLKGQPEGEGHHYLHMYMDATGVLQSIVRGPDEIALKGKPQQGVVANGSRLHFGPWRVEGVGEEATATGISQPGVVAEGSDLSRSVQGTARVSPPRG